MFIGITAAKKDYQTKYLKVFGTRAFMSMIKQNIYWNVNRKPGVQINCVCKLTLSNLKA